MSTYESFEILRDGRVATLALDRPENYNSLTASMGRERTAAIGELASDDGVGAILLVGRGKHFCAGGDIKRMKELIDKKTYITDESLKALDDTACAIRLCPKPVVAAVQGTATGGGCSLAMACDFRVAAPSSRFGMAFINLGLPGDTGGIYLLERLVGPTHAARMLMTGELIGGEEAYRIGLVSMLVAEEELESAAAALARKLSRKSASGLAAQKRVINKYFFGQELQDYFLDERREMAAASRCPDFTEAVYAFLEKRTPEFNKNHRAI